MNEVKRAPELRPKESVFKATTKAKLFLKVKKTTFPTKDRKHFFLDKKIEGNHLCESLSIHEYIKATKGSPNCPYNKYTHTNTHIHKMNIHVDVNE